MFEMLSLFTKPLQVGTTAPDFTLPDQDGREVSLSSLSGRNVVLIFYPRDGTPVCRKQLCEFRDSYASATAQNAAVFGVNGGAAGSHEAFRSKLKLPFPLLVDKEGEVARLYHAQGLLWPIRTVYVVGPDGQIIYARRGKPTPEEVLGATKAPPGGAV